MAYISGIEWDKVLTVLANLNAVKATDGTTLTTSNMSNYEVIPYVIKLANWYKDGKVVAPWSDYDGLFINSNWQRGSDGYYYYNGTVAANTTVTLFTAYTATDGPDGAHLEMDIISQVIQAEGMGATSAQDAFSKAANN